MKYFLIFGLLGILGIGMYYSRHSGSELPDKKTIVKSVRKEKNRKKAENKAKRKKEKKFRVNKKRRKIEKKSTKKEKKIVHVIPRSVVSKPVGRSVSKPANVGTGKPEKANKLTEKEISNYLKIIEKLKPLHKKVKIMRGDWLKTQKEPGQTFKQYIKCKPVLPTSNRKIIQIYPIGNMDPIWVKIVKITEEFMKIFFNLPVEIKETISADKVPTNQRRKRSGRIQLNAEYILEHILLSKVTKKVVAVAGITAWDLFEDPAWNFVFGLAYTEDRASISSFARYGDPKKNYKTVLLRVLGTVVHEAGHMFTIEHCIEYDCVMCGSMNLKESDRRGIWLCPHCVAKFSWAFKVNAVERYKKLRNFFSKYGFKNEVAFYDRSLAALAK